MLSTPMQVGARSADVVAAIDKTRRRRGQVAAPLPRAGAGYESDPGFAAVVRLSGRRSWPLVGCRSVQECGASTVVSRYAAGRVRDEMQRRKGGGPNRRQLKRVVAIPERPRDSGKARRQDRGPRAQNCPRQRAARFCQAWLNWTQIPDVGSLHFCLMDNTPSLKSSISLSRQNRAQFFRVLPR